MHTRVVKKLRCFDVSFNRFAHYLNRHFGPIIEYSANTLLAQYVKRSWLLLAVVRLVSHRFENNFNSQLAALYFLRHVGLELETPKSLAVFCDFRRRPRPGATLRNVLKHSTTAALV